MKIKDIRQFRTLYKNEIREIESSNRNEHFVGVRTEISGKSQYGFFEIYHGDKEGFNHSDGIRGFLEGFLDMAKDGQAVYEFMQNAVDAWSTRFCLFWGKDEVDGNTYLLVVNNGVMFDMDGIRSILNVGVSTKAANNFQIGKFGIGFKLAHRLVGRENGLDELIYQNYGPILFSWTQNEILELEKLIETPEVIPHKQDYEIFSENGKRKAIIKSDEPWLFKILITNFPCQPENESVPEIIYDNQYQPTSKAFNKNELRALARWVQKHSQYLKNDFDKGSLFFIRLGQGKQSHLEEENLEEGVKFSLAILNKIAKQSLNHDGLKTLNLRGKELEPVKLQFESFIISKIEAKNEYRFLRFGKSENLTEVELSKEQSDSDIEILLGYTDYKLSKEAFHNAPNFYLFFPLSEEKHKLRFILHSNAFYKSSSRTYLQKGSVGEEGINERLFRVFVNKLMERMLHWASSTSKSDKAKFLELYANLLLSNASDNPERIWVNEPLWRPILNFLENNIPVKHNANNVFKLINQSNKVRIKNTVAPVDSENWTQGSVEWFIWDAIENELALEATVKLKIPKFNIIDVLRLKDIALKLNLWLEEAGYSYAPTIIEELNEVSIANIKPSDLFWSNFEMLKIWEFEDGYFSIADIGNPSEYSNRLILFDTLDAIKDQLIKGGWKLSKKSLSEFLNLATPIQNKFQAVVKYIRRNEELINVLNLKLPYAELLRSEKLSVIKVLAKKLSDDKEDRISKLRELKLFRNALGQPIALKSLLKSSQIRWLSLWIIHSEDYDPILDDYLITNSDDIYQNIIFSHWKELVDRLTSDSEIRSLFDYAKGVYKLNNKLNFLSEKEIVRIANTFVNQSSSFFYSSSLLDFSESEYPILKSFLLKLNAQPIPDYELLKYYQEPPFKIPPKELIFSITTSITITLEEAKVFFKLCTKEKPEVFKSLSVEQTVCGEIVISPKVEGQYLVVSDSPLVNNYIAKYHSNIFIIFPISLKEFATAINLQGTALIKRLCVECDLGNEEQLATLIEVALQSDIEARKFLINKIPRIQFLLSKPLSPESVSVRFIRLLNSITDDNLSRAIIKAKTTIISDTDVIKLAEVQLLGNDQVSFDKGEKKLSLSLILISAESKATKLVGQLTESIAMMGIAEKAVLDRMFGLTGEVDKSFIATQIKEKYDGQVLENAHQLAFVLHYSKLQGKDFLIESFKVECKNRSIFLKDVVLYALDDSKKFIPESLILSSKYDELPTLLFDNASVYKGLSGVIICNAPYFENNKFFLPGISKIESEENQLLFIDFLFNKWKAAKDQLHNIVLGDNKKWFDIIGFEPFLTISSGDLIVESEKLPEFIQEWLSESEREINPKERYDFIRALGVSLSGADILRIRKYLVGQESVMPNINYSLPVALVVNTFTLLLERKSMYSLTDSRIPLLKDLYQRLPDGINPFEIPMPVISQVSDDAISFEKLNGALSIDVLQIERLRAIGYPIRNLPLDAGLPIVFSGLFGNVNKFTNAFSEIKVSFGYLDKNSIELYGKSWQSDFYLEWHQSFPSYEIICYPGPLPRCISLNDANIFTYGEGNIDRMGNMIIVNGELLDKFLIELIEARNYLPTNALNKLKELFNQQLDSFQEFLSRVQSNKKLKEEWEKLKQKDKEEQKKKQLGENIGTKERYSMLWFMSLLDLMVMTGQGKDVSSNEGDIIFNKFIYNPIDLRTVIFASPSRSIPPSIDLYSDFNAIFTYTDVHGTKKKKEIQIKGLTKKGQEVVALPTRPIDLELINLSKVTSVELRFVKMLKLIQKLTEAFRELAFPDEYNLKDKLSENTRFIFGPPGTGKTTEIAKIVVEKIKENKNKKILILTPTNNSADEIVKKILQESPDELYPDNWLVRFGASTDELLNDRGIIYDSSSFEMHLYSKCVLVTTIQRFPYEQIISNEGAFGQEKTFISSIPWDAIFFDEASMIMLPAIIYPMFKRKYKRDGETELTEFIIAGDPLQIPPIFDLPDEELPEDQKDVKEENIYSMICLKSFEDRQQALIPKFGNKIKNLKEQFRSVEIIGELFSQFQYGGKLTHGRSFGRGGTPLSRPLPDSLVKLGFKPITVIYYKVDTSDAIYNPHKLNGSPLHLYSAFLVNEILLKLRSSVTDNWDIGLIAPYRSQATLLDKLVEIHSDQSKLNVTTDTVHGFQGSQCDLVFAILNPSSTSLGYSRFLKREFILNVAISRAKDYLIILLPDNDTKASLRLIDESYEGSMMSIIKRLPQESVSIMKAERLEEQITGTLNYFQKSTITNAHQDVNLYTELIRNYMVRVSGNALDIHLRKQ